MSKSHLKLSEPSKLILKGPPTTAAAAAASAAAPGKRAALDLSAAAGAAAGPALGPRSEPWDRLVGPSRELLRAAHGVVRAPSPADIRTE